MKKLIRTSVLLFLIACTSVTLQAQVSVLSATINSLQITSQNFFQVTLFNPSSKSANVMMEAKLFNSANELICSGKTLPFIINPGTSSPAQMKIQVSEFVYGSQSQASYLKTTHALPSGVYKYCVKVIEIPGMEADEYCEDIESVISSFLDLVVPYDKDTVDSQYPVLIWTHSEAFNLLAKGESFRMVLVEIQEGQTPESAVISNQPVFFKNFLTAHNIQYPTDARELKPGKHYAWQVQKIAGNTIIDKTEAWEFIVKLIEPDKDNKYCVLKSKPDAGYYTAYNKKIFFRFDEEYNGSVLVISIYDEKRKKIEPKTDNEQKLDDNAPSSNVKTSGFNRFELDLQPYHLKKGFYMMEVINEKKEKFILKFYVD